MTGATITFESMTSAANPISSKRRSILFVSSVSDGAATAATIPGMATIKPAVPTDTCTSAAIVPSRPMGRNSVVITTKAAVATEATASHDRTPLFPGFVAIRSVIEELLDETSVRATPDSRSDCRRLDEGKVCCQSLTPVGWSP